MQGLKSWNKFLNTPADLYSAVTSPRAHTPSAHTTPAPAQHKPLNQHAHTRGTLFSLLGFRVKVSGEINMWKRKKGSICPVWGSPGSAEGDLCQAWGGHPAALGVIGWHMWRGAKAYLQNDCFRPAAPPTALTDWSQPACRVGGGDPAHLVHSSISGGGHCWILGVQCAFCPDGRGHLHLKGRSSCVGGSRALTPGSGTR